MGPFFQEFFFNKRHCVYRFMHMMLIAFIFLISRNMHIFYNDVFFSRISAEKLLHLHTYYRVFAYQPKVVVEETLVHDPHKAQSSWQSADESELNQKHVPLSPNIKTLPRSSPG